MTLYSVVLFFHVLAAAFLVGHSVGTPLVLAAIRKAPTARTLLGWLGFARDAGRANPFAALALLASGTYLASGRWSEGWIWASYVLWLANSALAVAVVKATGERLAGLALAAGDGPIAPELDALRRAASWSLAAHVLIGNDLAALFLMSVQPGWLGSVAAVLAANGAVLALRSLRDRRAAAADVAALPSAA